MLFRSSPLPSQAPLPPHLESLVLQDLLDGHTLVPLQQSGLVHHPKRPAADHPEVGVADVLLSVWRGANCSVDVSDAVAILTP